MTNFERIERLAREHSLEAKEYEILLGTITKEETDLLAAKAREKREQVYGNEVYYRGLVEISNICKNDCLYCGIRASNHKCERYRLSAEEILACCQEGYALGFRSFVLQGGEDGFFTDELLCSLIVEIKKSCPDSAVTLSLGERGLESYKRLKEAGADRYLLRHETIDETHYGQLHPAQMSFEKRQECLKWLRECGYQVGCGFMVGTPGQSDEMLARELKFFERFRPDMFGIGPFIPHSDTPFGNKPAGSVEKTCVLLSCLRLIYPQVLLPATTALASLGQDGRQRGLLAGANVVMPNLSPKSVRNKYALYNNKKSSGSESAQQICKLQTLVESIGMTLHSGKGDRKDWNNGNL